MSSLPERSVPSIARTLPPGANCFRFTDILRGLVAQPILAAYGYQGGFTGATVVQKNNPHDYMKDFVSEIPLCERSRRVIQSRLGSVFAKVNYQR